MQIDFDHELLRFARNDYFDFVFFEPPRHEVFLLFSGLVIFELWILNAF